jgi:glucokinase
LQRVFREVARGDGLSAPSVARACGLSATVAASALRALERRGLVRVERRRVRVNPDFGRVVGIDLGASHVHYALADFAGVIRDELTEPVHPEDGPRRMLAQIKAGVERLLAGAKAPSARRGRKLLALAMGVPSPVDDRGVATYANNLPGWTNVRLRDELVKVFRLPVRLENDVNLAAIGEHWKGVAKGVENFVFIALGTGVGSGVFVHGRLYRGRVGAAGEIFRMNVEWPRWQTDYGDTGQFEDYVSGRGIAREGRHLRAEGAAAGLREERDARFVFEAHRRGDPEARRVLEKIFTILGVGVANLVAILDPELIVLGGGVTRGAPDLMLAIVRRVVARIHPETQPPITLSALEDKAQTFGAIRSALDAAGERIARQLR